MTQQSTPETLDEFFDDGFITGHVDILNSTTIVNGRPDATCFPGLWKENPSGSVTVAQFPVTGPQPLRDEARPLTVVTFPAWRVLQMSQALVAPTPEG